MYRRQTNGKVIVIIWVDDLIIAARGEKVVSDMKNMLAEKLRMKDLGKLRHFLGADFSLMDVNLCHRKST